jgi:hypothetical protein
MLECRYENLQDEWERAYIINPYLAASVTGWARVLLHKKIRETGVIMWLTFTNQESTRTNGTIKALVLGIGEMNWKRD